MPARQPGEPKWRSPPTRPGRPEAPLSERGGLSRGRKVKFLCQENLLTQNRMPVGKHIVNLKHITCPVLNIMAGHDDLVPCSQGTPFNDLVGSSDRKTILLHDSGHIGLAIGGRAQREVWPQVCDWLAQRTS